MTLTEVRGLTMRERFAATAANLIESDPRVALVLADISADAFADLARRFPDRVLNVGIREQLMASTAGGLALAGMRPILHSYAPFVVSRAYEQLKLDIGHQDVDAVVVSIGASYDSAASGRTHFAPEDVALIDTLTGWQVHVPAHVDEVDDLIACAVWDGGRHYIRLTDNAAPPTVLPTSDKPRAVVIAVGPTIANVVTATRHLDVEILPVTAIRPFPADALRHALARAATSDVVLVEPYYAGTSAHEVAAALTDVRHRLLSLGVGRRDLRRYGSAAEHDAAHGLDVAGLRRDITGFLGSSRRMRLA